MLIGVDSDLLFPIHQQEALAQGLKSFVKDVRFARPDSMQVHDSFQVDMDRFRQAIASFF